MAAFFRKKFLNVICEEIYLNRRSYCHMDFFGLAVSDPNLLEVKANLMVRDGS